MRAYIKHSHEMSQPVRGDDLDYVWFGFLLLASPVFAPLYYFGRVANWMWER